MASMEQSQILRCCPKGRDSNVHTHTRAWILYSLRNCIWVCI